jgi:hypothetical protein
MKNLFILLGFIGLISAFGTSVNAQTKISFEKGASKTLTVSIPAQSEKRYSVLVKKNQVINVTVSGDINVSKDVEFPVISVNLVNGEEGVDNWQDGEGYLSVLTGTDGNFIFSVSNSSNRTRVFRMRVAVTNDPDDYMGGIEVNQE